MAVHVLLRTGANILHQDADGNTCLHLAAMRGFSGLCHDLVVRTVLALAVGNQDADTMLQAFPGGLSLCGMPNNLASTPSMVRSQCFVMVWVMSECNEQTLQMAARARSTGTASRSLVWFLRTSSGSLAALRT